MGSKGRNWDANGEPGKTKALLRELVAELKVNSKTEIPPTYYLNTAPVGIEPMTFSLESTSSLNPHC
jgi:hypothetical protein